MLTTQPKEIVALLHLGVQYIYGKISPAQRRGVFTSFMYTTLTILYCVLLLRNNSCVVLKSALVDTEAFSQNQEPRKAIVAFFYGVFLRQHPIIQIFFYLVQVQTMITTSLSSVPGWTWVYFSTELPSKIPTNPSSLLSKKDFPLCLSLRRILRGVSKVIYCLSGAMCTP